MTDEEMQPVIEWYVNHWKLYLCHQLDHLEPDARELAEWREMRDCFVTAKKGIAIFPENFTGSDIRRALFIASERIVTQRMVEKLKGTRAETDSFYYVDGGYTDSYWSSHPAQRMKAQENLRKLFDRR